MTLVDRKLSAKTETTTTAGGFFHVILPSGAIFVSRKISIDSIIAANNADRTHTQVFDNSDLSSGVLSVNHGKGTEDVEFNLKTPAGVIYNASVTFAVTDDDNVTVDFGGEIDSGNWILTLRCYK